MKPNRVIVLISLGLLMAVTLVAQEREEPGETPTDRALAPAIPLQRDVIDEYIAREVPIAERTGVPVRIVRLGHAGTLERPETLGIPEEGGTAIPLYRYDWLRANDRDVEIRTRTSFVPVVVLKPATQVIIVSRGQIELLHGILAWEFTSRDAVSVAVSAGSVAIRGRGDATLQRDVNGISIVVTAGRFDVYRDGAVIAVLGGGQQRLFPINPESDDNRGGAGASRSFPDLHPQFLSELDGALDEIRAEAIGGERLAAVWETAAAVGAAYAPLEERSDPRIENPDIVLREIAEALRILAAYEFLPPPARGM